MGWISLQMQWGLNTTQGGKGGSGGETWLNQTGLLVTFATTASRFPVFYHLAHPTPRGGNLGLCCLGSAEDPGASPAGVRPRGSWTHPASLRLLSRKPGRSGWKAFLWRQLFPAHPRLLKWADVKEEGAGESAERHT